MIDGILYISNLPALINLVSQANPEMVTGDVINGFARTPAVMNGAAALVYVRMTEAEADQWRGTPYVTILAEAPYTGVNTADNVYEALANDAEALAIYNATYDRSPVEISGEGENNFYNPPFRFGAIA